MNTEEAFTPEQVTEVVGALHNATMDKWLGAGLTLVIGAVVIKIVMRALNRLVAKLPLDKAMLSFLTAAARIVMVIVLGTMVAGCLLYTSGIFEIVSACGRFRPFQMPKAGTTKP